jgi:PAS domain S-box-containing protein
LGILLESERMGDRLSHELLLLLSRLVEERDEGRVIALFRETVNGAYGRPVVGPFRTDPDGPRIELATPRTRFGGYPLVSDAELTPEAFASVTAAAETVAIILEGLADRRADLERERRLERDIEAATYELSVRADTYRLLLDSLPNAVYLWELGADDRLRCRELNDAAGRMLGYEREEIIGRPPECLVNDSGEPTVSDYVGVLRAELRCAFATSHQTRDGVTIPVDVEAAAMDSEGRIYVVTTVREAA